MTEAVVVSGLGTSTAVDLGSAIDPTVFRTAWSRCVDLAPRPPERMGPSGRVAGPYPSMTGLTRMITGELIGARVGELLMLHAGAVCNTTTGATIAYAAPGGTGKSTLTRRLGKTLGYITDETVGVEPGTWRVHPYPKPLSLRNSDTDHSKSEHDPQGLGMLVAHREPRLRALLILRRDPTIISPIWSRLHLFDAIVALAPETSSLGALDRPLHLLADLYRSLGGFWLVRYGEAEQIVDRVRALVEES